MMAFELAGFPVFFQAVTKATSTRPAADSETPDGWDLGLPGLARSFSREPCSTLPNGRLAIEGCADLHRLDAVRPWEVQ